jgi:hypothetical protein
MLASRWMRATAITLLAVVASLGAPWVAASSAQAGGADKPRPMTFGDCKNSNEGVHNGYDCEEEPEPTLVEGEPGGEIFT